MTNPGWLKCVISKCFLVLEDDVPVNAVSTVSSETRKSSNIQGVDDTGDVTQNGQQDVDQQIGTTSALEEDTDGRQKDGEDDFDDVSAIGVSEIF